MKNTLLVCLLAAAIGGCHSSGSLTDENRSITASEFQQSCTVASDCVPVYEGTLSCCGGSCPNAAVNQVGHDAYEVALASRTPVCNPEPPCAALTDVICQSGAICENGTCKFYPAGTDDAGQPCPLGCPATAHGAFIEVKTTPAMAVNGVQATLSGPETGAMSCAPSLDEIVCAWPDGVAATPGTYALEVSAPGYQTMTVQVAVTVSPPSCGCTTAHIEPSTVVLSPG
jgi:hypothetical protein